MLKGFITNLGKYNEGELVGEWISFPIEEEELEEVLEQIGISDEPNEDGSYYEEFFFTDWEYEDIPNLHLGEYENIESVNEIAEILEGKNSKVVLAIVEATDYGVVEAAGEIDRCIFYEGKTLVEVAEDIVENCYDLPAFAKKYFDYKAFASDLEDEGYTETEYGTIVVD